MQVCIPGRLASLLQPLDCINQPFEADLKHFYLEWMVTTIHETTSTRRVKKPSLALICEWILAALGFIPNNLALMSFKKCISNSCDGSEDSAMLDDDNYVLS